MTNQIKLGRFIANTSSSSSVQQQRQWLNLNPNVFATLLISLVVTALMALPKEMFLNKNETPYSSDQGPNLSLPLEVLEDPSLSFDQGPIVKARRPPGVQSLAEWGEIKLPEGKWKGHSFSEAFVLDPKYASFMAGNVKLVSPWALSFHQYSRLRMQTELQYKEKKIEQERAQLKLQQAMLSAMSSDPRPRDWEVISAASTPMTSQGTLKRSAVEVEEKKGMITEMDAQTKEEKMLKLALLQRGMDLIKKEMEEQ